MAEAILRDRYSGDAEKTEEKLLHAGFLHARNEYVKAHQEWKLAASQKLPLRRLGAIRDEHKHRSDGTLEAYLSVYEARHGTRQALARRSLLESDTIYQERIPVAQHMYGRAVGAAGHVVMAAGSGLETFAASHSETVRKSPLSRAAIRYLASGAALAAVAFLALHYVPALTAAVLIKRGTTGLVGRAFFKYVLPRVFSHSSFFQRNPRALAELRNILGWAGFGVGWFASYEISAHTMQYAHIRSPDESLNTTARAIGVRNIEQIRGGPRFMPVDHSPESPLGKTVNDMSLAYDIRSSSPELSRVWTNRAVWN